MYSDYDKLFFGERKYIKCVCGCVILQQRHFNHLHSRRHEDYLINGMPRDRKIKRK